MNIYALYKGEEFIDVGTAKEIAERQGMTAKAVRWLAGSKAQKEAEENGANILIAVVVEKGIKDGITYNRSKAKGV